MFIVEGESDCWTLWHYGLPAVGAPGKSTWKREWVALLAGIDGVYIWQEPGAEDFALRIGADIPTARVIHAPEGAKDPSALHVLGRDVAAEMEALRAVATPVAEMFQAAWEGLRLVFAWPNVLYPVAGTLLAMAVAFLPGISGVTLMTLMIPFTLSWEPLPVVLLFGGLVGGATFMGSGRDHRLGEDQRRRRFCE